MGALRAAIRDIVLLAKDDILHFPKQERDEALVDLNKFEGDVEVADAAAAQILALLNPQPPKPSPRVQGAVEETDNIAILTQVCSEDIPIDRVLIAAQGEMSSGVLVGWDEDGDVYFASSIADGATVLWLLEIAKLRILQKGGALLP